MSALAAHDANQVGPTTGELLNLGSDGPFVRGSANQVGTLTGEFTIFLGRSANPVGI